MHNLSPNKVRAIKLSLLSFQIGKNLSLERHILTCVEYFFQAPCYKGKCKYGGHCELVTNTTARCSCPLCHFRYKPVCGTDRRSYINHCFLRRQACLTKTSILVAQRGRCCKSAFLIYLYSCYSGHPSFFSALVQGTRIKKKGQCHAASKGGAVVRALASRQCGLVQKPASTPYVG